MVSFILGGIAMADGLSGGRQQFPVTVICPKCSQTGSAIWEENTLPNPRGLKPMIISLPDGFYHRVKKNHSLLPEVVCEKCGTVVLD
jgi:uncharacterized OB-fold protein